jgi:hypothetical protein
MGSSRIGNPLHASCLRTCRAASPERRARSLGEDRNMETRMKRYEFKVISARCTDLHPQSIPTFEATLNNLGKDGWSLVSCTTVMGGPFFMRCPIATAVLQREVTSTSVKGDVHDS